MNKTQNVSHIAYHVLPNLGFTLIELLVVISVLGLLAGLIVSNVSGIRERARDAQRKSDLRQVKEALRMYHNDFDTYPPSGATGTIKGCGDGSVECSWGGSFSVTGGSTYMGVLPLDPSSGSYFYLFIDRDGFSLYAVLENKSDADIGKSQSRCSISGQEETLRYYVCAD